jgi:hypothetical protein
LLLISTENTPATSGGDKHHACDVVIQRALTGCEPNMHDSSGLLTKFVPVTVTLVPVRAK